MDATRTDQAAVSAGMYRALFEGSPHPVLIVEPGSLRILRANRAAAAAYGHALEDLVHQPLGALSPRGAFEVQEISFGGSPALALYPARGISHEGQPALLKAQARLLEMVARGDEMMPVLEELVATMEQLSGEMIGSVLLLDEEGRRAHHGAASRLPVEYWQAIDGMPIGPRAGSCGTAMFLNETVVVADIATDPLWEDYREFALAHGLRACWSAPIRARTGKVLGAFAMYYRRPGLPPEGDKLLVGVAVQLASLAIERERAERALQESESRLRAVIDHAPAAVSLKDIQGRYVLVNRRFEEITGVAGTHALRKTDAQLFAPHLAEAYAAHDREVLEGRRAREFEEHVAQADGVHVYRAFRFPIQQPGGWLCGIGAILFDITEHKHAERALLRAREEERTRMSREIHDELGQMLTALQLSQALLLDSLRCGAQAEVIAAEVARMREWVGGMLATVKRICANLRPEPLDRLPLGTAIERHVARFCQQTDIACSVTIGDDARNADPERATALFRILQEALTNVARHAGATEVRIDVRRDGGFHLMTVTDNGCGIEETIPAGRASLGLLGMGERAAALGGTVSVSAARGAGTRVEARIPVE